MPDGCVVALDVDLNGAVGRVANRPCDRVAAGDFVDLVAKAHALDDSMQNDDLSLHAARLTAAAPRTFAAVGIFAAPARSVAL